jgi:hypothetical protein
MVFENMIIIIYKILFDQKYIKIIFNFLLISAYKKNYNKKN